MFKPRIKQTPPRLTPLIGRASPRGSKNFGGLNKGIDMPNQSALQTEDDSPLGSATAKYKHDMPPFKFGQ